MRSGRKRENELRRIEGKCPGSRSKLELQRDAGLDFHGLFGRIEELALVLELELQNSVRKVVRPAQTETTCRVRDSNDLFALAVRFLRLIGKGVAGLWAREHSRRAIARNQTHLEPSSRDGPAGVL
jgi:hypothetical protein